MREKLLDLMKNEGLKPSQLAELLEINPGGNFPYSRRTKQAGLRFVTKDSPEVPADQSRLAAARFRQDVSRQRTRTIRTGRAVESSISDGLSVPARNTPLNRRIRMPASTTSENPAPPATAPFSGTRTDVAVRRIVILYDDLTFESFTPTKR